MSSQNPSMFDVQNVQISLVKDILVRTGSLQALKELERELGQLELIDIEEAYTFAEYLYRENSLEKLPAKATIQSWISEGRLKQRGYLPTKKSVGRPKVLISKIDLIEILNEPPKIGRPLASDRSGPIQKKQKSKSKPSKSETMSLFDI